MRRELMRGVATGVSCALALVVPRTASACGGCFHGPPPPMAETTVVTGHRMALALSNERTVLWDQIKYAGAPEDFSWVLPVRPGATIEASTDSWFDSLEGVTATRVSAPVLRCASSPNGGGCGCAGSLSASPGLAEDGTGNNGGVTVLHEGTVGPYDTVTLQSTDGDTLSAWLGSHGYTVPPDIAPIISSYVSEGYDFIALRLSPDKGIAQMAPVRVVTPGSGVPLPLRMVAAGVGLSVAITLYVIGEQRYGLPDLTESFINPKELAWDFAASQSNYADLREEALAWYLGYRYLTTFAAPGAFYRGYTDPDGTPVRYLAGGNSFASLADLYFSPTSCPSIDDTLRSTALVEAAPGPGEIAAANLSCQKYDDIGAAMIGMHPASVWLTRLDMDLLREGLSADCVVSPNPSQQLVSQYWRATKAENIPASCEQPIFASSLITVSPRGALAWLVVLGTALFGRLRRRGR